MFSIPRRYGVRLIPVSSLSSASSWFRRKFSDSFGSFRNGTFGKFTGKHNSHARLDFPTAQYILVVEPGQLERARGYIFKNLVQKFVHEVSSFLVDLFDIRVDLLEHRANEFVVFACASFLFLSVDVCSNNPQQICNTNIRIGSGCAARRDRQQKDRNPAKQSINPRKHKKPELTAVYWDQHLP